MTEEGMRVMSEAADLCDRVQHPARRATAGGEVTTTSPRRKRGNDADAAALPDTVMLYLPECPSMNAYWRAYKPKNGPPRNILSKEGRAYKKAAADALLLQRIRVSADPIFPRGDVIVEIIWNRSRRAGDLDNRIKPTLDVLKGVVFADDSQVSQITARRTDGHKSGWPMVVHVTRIFPAQALSPSDRGGNG